MKFNYYNIDVGFFPTEVKVCFTRKAFFEILETYNIPVNDVKPLEQGLAETYLFLNNKETLVVVVYGLDTIEENITALVGCIAHESVHVVERILEHIGEERDDFGEETRAYLIQHIVEQTFEASVMEMNKNARRKGGRNKAKGTNPGPEGTLHKVGEPRHDGSTGSGDHPQGEGLLRGVEGPKGDIIGTTTTSSATVSRGWRRGYCSIQCPSGGRFH